MISTRCRNTLRTLASAIVFVAAPLVSRSADAPYALPSSEWKSLFNGKDLTGWDGAIVNAECVLAGLKALKGDPFASYFSERAKPVAAADLTKPAPPPAVVKKPEAPKTEG